VLIPRRKADAPALAANRRPHLPPLVPMRGGDVAADTGPVLGVGAVAAPALVEHVLLDYLVRPTQHSRRDGQARHLGRLEVDEQLAPFVMLPVPRIMLGRRVL
jgi:hypothetical protein